MTVEVVVTHYRRPANMKPILEAIRAQSRRPDVITIIDTKKSSFLPEEARVLADRTIYLDTNYGCFNRYVPLGAYEQDFTLFCDDDFALAPRAVDNLLTWAAQLGEFGVLGQSGRRIPQDGTYVAHDIQAKDKPIQVDTIVRAYFVRTRLLHHIYPLAQLLGRRHDDILLSCGLSRLGLSNLVLPCQEDSRLFGTELPDAHACWRQPDHMSSRSVCFQQLLKAGWWTPCGL